MARAELGGESRPPLSERLPRYRSKRWWSVLRRAPARALPWLPVCAAFVAIGIAIGSFGQARLHDDPERGNDRPAATAARDTRPLRTERARETAPEVRLVTDGVTVQVLNATTWRRAGDRMRRRLERLGFSVPAQNPASKTYRQTTVFWSRPAGRAAARGLAERFGWEVARKPRNLSASVTIHVVVGADEARG